MATIYKIWMLRYVDVPKEIGHALEKESGKKKHIPVVAIVNGRSTRTTLMPAGGGQYRLQFNVTLRKAAHADIGDVVGVELRIDRGSRIVPIPAELKDALKHRRAERKVFEKMGKGTRRQLLLYIVKAKSPEVRRKRIARFLEILLEHSLLGSTRKH
ncbi:MAG: YdeI/OmpD-associated family protein [Candidatus Acidiferrales bacterium]